ncbi:PREDICTED: ER membrane protein complex subunit 8/9 homolog [Amphimedon queenslandica]|nr:PREDICTED: ER membrane protein complex subunit 8/9 homolog [Amphimedon queenslandica]|eukprot:XP_019861287.1 PREDICTED: ER membrane protein complex subunit 8/9 homolog [Amphimedon queenslandica]
MVCNDTVLQQQDDSLSLKMFTCSDASSGVWREQKELSVINGDQTIPAVKKLIFNGVYKKLIDFDNHLENVNDDWTNTDINKAIEGI